MFKRIVLAGAVIAALVSGAVSANAQGWHRGGWHGGWGGPVIVLAPPLYPTPCQRVWDGYMLRFACNYSYAPPMVYMPPPMPPRSYNPPSQSPYKYDPNGPSAAWRPMNLPPPIPNVCTMLAGNAVAGNGQPICRH